jgi:hypothetical protein
VEAAIALDLPFQSIEKIALKFGDLPTAEARHMDVVSLRATLVVMFLALQMHEVEFIDESMALKQIEGAVDSNSIDVRIQSARLAKDLAGIQMLLGSFDNTEDGPALARHPQSTRHEFRL